MTVSPDKKHLAIVVNTTRFFLTHRLHLANGARNLGFDVHVIAPPDSLASQIQQMGFTFHPVPMGRKSISPLTELRTLFALCKNLRQISPDVVHLFTIKPVIYGTIAARLMGIKSIVATITGLGFIFLREGFLSEFTKSTVGFVYRIIFASRRVRVIFQNQTDRDYFVGHGWAQAHRSHIIAGTGVDIEKFTYADEPPPPINIAFPARFLRDKGLFELIAAGDALMARDLKFQIWLCGSLDEGNPNSATSEQLDRICQKPFVKNLGYCEDMAGVFRRAHVVCLPSYREGLSLSLLEAAAAGRPVVTTDAPGCRDAVENGVTGFIVPTKDCEILAEKLAVLIENPSLRMTMARAARERAVKLFSKEITVRQNLELYEKSSNDRSF